MILSAAERLLQELGVTEPAEIDLEAIAYHVGASVRSRPLDGCEARIIGCSGRAIITVNSRSSVRRRRFSIAHELGHWRHHKDKTLVCRAEEYMPSRSSPAERVADLYAADLLMPNYLFRPIARQQDKLNFATIVALADAFNTSVTSTVIRLVESDLWPSLVVCHGHKGRKWFTRSPSVPARWFPRDDLDSESHAIDVLFGREAESRVPQKIGADAWFDRWDAERFELAEQSIRVSDKEILTLLILTDGKMLDD